MNARWQKQLTSYNKEEQTTLQIHRKIRFIDSSIKWISSHGNKRKFCWAFPEKLLVFIIIYGHRSPLCLFTLYDSLKRFPSTPLWRRAWNLIVFNEWWKGANGKENSCTFKTVKAKQCSLSVDNLLLLFLFNRFHLEVLFPQQKQKLFSLKWHLWYF